jgi:hypothetical protein
MKMKTVGKKSKIFTLQRDADRQQSNNKIFC